MKRITIGDRSMLVLGTVQGLTREKEKVRTAFDTFEPDMVALPISDEMLEGLKAVVEGEVKEVATNSIDDLFADHLRRFGEVQLPPPSLVEAYRLSKARDIGVTTLDMDEEAYAEAYTTHVSGYHFWRRIWNLSRLSKRTFVADTPEEFVVIWDAYISKLKGYANLERHRERYMADRGLALLKTHRKVLLVVEYERMEGVTREIARLASEKGDTAEDAISAEEETTGDPVVITDGEGAKETKQDPGGADLTERETSPEERTTGDPGDTPHRERYIGP